VISKKKRKTVPIPVTCVAYVDSHVGTDKLLLFVQVYRSHDVASTHKKKVCGLYQTWDRLQRGSIYEIFFP